MSSYCCGCEQLCTYLSGEEVGVVAVRLQHSQEQEEKHFHRLLTEENMYVYIQGLLYTVNSMHLKVL